MPSFLYEFADEWPSGLSSLFGAFHGIELSYLFASFQAFGIAPTAQDEQLAARLQAAWIGMTDGAPADTTWSPYSRSAPNFMLYGNEPIATSAPYREGRCEGLRALALVP